MTITLNLPAHVGQAFLAEAQANGKTVDELVLDVLLALHPTPLAAEMQPEQWVEEFKAWTRSHAADNLPVLTEEATSRDFIYRERGL